MAQEYARALAKVVVAQTAETLGFDSVQQSASDALAELLLQYISELGSLTHGFAEMAGRTDCNINDLVRLILKYHQLCCTFNLHSRSLSCS